MRPPLAALGVVSLVALVAVASGGARSTTTAPPAVVPVKVTLTDTTVQIHPKTAVRGTMGRFIIVNRGSKPHTFTFGQPNNSGKGMQTGFTRTVKPREQSTIILFLDFRGQLKYSGALGGRSLAGAKSNGTFRIY